MTTTEKKTYFSLACSLLSKMVKDKQQGRRIGVGGEMQCRPVPPPITMDLLSGIDASSADEDQSATETETSAKPRPPPPQLTIFYDGKMFVFGDIPEQKANDLMMQTAACSTITTTTTTVVMPKRNNNNSTDLLAQTRRASLHGFLNKRKERIIASTAPYQIHGSPPPTKKKKMVVATSNPEETHSWLTLGQQTDHWELRNN